MECQAGEVDFEVLVVSQFEVRGEFGAHQRNLARSFKFFPDTIRPVCGQTTGSIDFFLHRPTMFAMKHRALFGTRSECKPMESQPTQNHSTEASVKPASRFLRFGLATITAPVLGSIVLVVTHATGMFAGGYSPWFQSGLVWLWLLGPLALVVGIAAAAYPRRWLTGRHPAFIVAAVGAAAGCLSCLVLLGWMILLGHTGQLRYGWRDLGTILPFQFELQAVTWLIVIGASAMLVTLTRRRPTVLVSVAVLCVLAVVLPSPIFNFVTHNQELTVAFVVPANPGASAARPLRAFSVATGSHWLSQAGADAVAAHVLEALRKAGLPGPYRVAEVNQSGIGKKALQIIVLNPPFPAEAQLPQPDGTELIYVSQPDGWHKIPAQARTLSRNTEIRRPDTGYRWMASYSIHMATYPDGFGGAIWPN